MHIDTPEIAGEATNLSYYEVILRDGRTVGHVSSGGYALHAGRSIAMGYVAAEMALTREQFDIQKSGRALPCTRSTHPSLRSRRSVNAGLLPQPGTRSALANPDLFKLPRASGWA